MVQLAVIFFMLLFSLPSIAAADQKKGSGYFSYERFSALMGWNQKKLDKKNKGDSYEKDDGFVEISLDDGPSNEGPPLSQSMLLSRYEIEGDLAKTTETVHKEPQSKPPKKRKKRRDLKNSEEEVQKKCDEDKKKEAERSYKKKLNDFFSED